MENELEMERKTVRRVSEWIQTIPLSEHICPLCDGYCACCSCHTNNSNNNNNNNNTSSSGSSTTSSSNSNNSSNNNNKNEENHTENNNNNNNNTRICGTKTSTPPWTSIFKPLSHHNSNKGTLGSTSSQQHRRLVSRTTSIGQFQIRNCAATDLQSTSNEPDREAKGDLTVENVPWDTENADMLLMAEQCLFPVHRNVVCKHSKVLKSMLKVKQEFVVKLHVNASDMKLVLSYMYDLHVPLAFENAARLLFMSEMLGMKGLETKCKQFSKSMRQQPKVKERIKSLSDLFMRF